MSKKDSVKLNSHRFFMSLNQKVHQIIFKFDLSCSLNFSYENLMNIKI
jgi:hypothetical protein